MSSLKGVLYVEKSMALPKKNQRHGGGARSAGNHPE